MGGQQLPGRSPRRVRSAPSGGFRPPSAGRRGAVCAATLLEEAVWEFGTLDWKHWGIEESWGDPCRRKDALGRSQNAKALTDGALGRRYGPRKNPRGAGR